MENDVMENINDNDVVLVDVWSGLPCGVCGPESDIVPLRVNQDTNMQVVVPKAQHKLMMALIALACWPLDPSVIGLCDVLGLHGLNCLADEFEHLGYPTDEPVSLRTLASNVMSANSRYARHPNEMIEMVGSSAVQFLHWHPPSPVTSPVTWYRLLCAAKELEFRMRELNLLGYGWVQELNGWYLPSELGSNKWSGLVRRMCCVYLIPAYSSWQAMNVAVNGG